MTYVVVPAGAVAVTKINGLHDKSDIELNGLNSNGTILYALHVCGIFNFEVPFVFANDVIYFQIIEKCPLDLGPYSLDFAFQEPDPSVP